MNKFVRVLIALVVAVTPMSAVTPAQAETCAYYGTIFDGSPYARNFGTVCGQVNIDAIWPSVEAHINSNSAAYIVYMANKAAEEAARLAAEEAQHESLLQMLQMLQIALVQPLFLQAQDGK